MSEKNKSNRAGKPVKSEKANAKASTLEPSTRKKPKRKPHAHATKAGTPPAGTPRTPNTGKRECTPAAVVRAVTVGGREYRLPHADLLPPLTAEERDELRRSIRAAGRVLVPILVTEDDAVLDGHHRLAIADELGLSGVPAETVAGLSDEQRRARAMELNLARRHLTREQRRRIIEEELRRDATRSDRSVSARVGVSHATVAAARKKLESSGQIVHSPRRAGKDGVARHVPAKPTRRPAARPPAVRDGQAVVRSSPGTPTPVTPATEVPPAASSADATPAPGGTAGGVRADAIDRLRAAVDEAVGVCMGTGPVTAAEAKIVTDLADRLAQCAADLRVAVAPAGGGSTGAA